MRKKNELVKRAVGDRGEINECSAMVTSSLI